MAKVYRRQDWRAQAQFKRQVQTWLRVCGVLLLALLTYLQPYRPVVIRGKSMEPTFFSGQVVLAKRMERTQPHWGDIVVFELFGERMVKRITGTEGDRYPLVEGTRYTSIIPHRAFFMTGDNPAESWDSRDYGPVPEEAITYVVIAQLFAV